MSSIGVEAGRIQNAIVSTWEAVVLGNQKHFELGSAKACGESEICESPSCNEVGVCTCPEGYFFNGLGCAVATGHDDYINQLGEFWEKVPTCREDYTEHGTVRTENDPLGGKAYNFLIPNQPLS